MIRCRGWFEIKGLAGFSLQEEEVIWNIADLLGGGGGVLQWHSFEKDNAYKWDHYWHGGRPFGGKSTAPAAAFDSRETAANALQVYGNYR